MRDREGRGGVLGPPRTARTSGIRWRALAAAVAVALLLVFRADVPLNMDEFVSYQTLAAFTHPQSNENVFCSSNASFYLTLPGGPRLPLLTYDYIGSLSSLLYAPFFLLWRSPLSARLAGMVALLLQALILGRFFRFKTGAVFCVLLLFLPYSFVHIADTGPVAFQTTSVFLVCFLLHRWLLSRRPGRRAGMMAAAGLTIAGGCWVKPTYFFVSAGLAATALAVLALALRHFPRERGRRAAEYLLLLVCAAAPALLVYQAHQADGSPYLPVLTPQFVPSQVVFAGLAGRFRENVVHFVLHPLDATAPYFDVRPELPLWTALTCALGGALVLGSLCARRASARQRTEIVLNCGLFAVALLLVATNIYAKSMHHAVLAYPFVILAVARGLQRAAGPWLRGTLLLFVLVNGSLFLRFPSLLAAERATGSNKVYVAELHDELSRNHADAVVACVDWGIYFVQALYGPPSQVVLSLCVRDDQRAQLLQAAAIARRLHRPLAIVGLHDNRPLREILQADFPGATERPGPGDGDPWRIWLVPADHDRPAAGRTAAHSSGGVPSPPRA